MKSKNDKDHNLNHQAMASEFMPTDQAIQDELIRRAKLLAVKYDNHETQASFMSYIQFKLGKECYGIPYENIKEVMSNIILTSIPNLPNYIAGIINLRGSLIAVIHLKNLFSISSHEASENPQIIIVESHAMTVGMLVDNITGNDVYDPSLLDSPLVSPSIAKEFILGIHQGHVAILNIENILTDFDSHIETKPQVMQ